MEVVVLPYSPEQSVSSSYKQMKTPKRNARAFYCKPIENLAPINFHGGLFHAPPPSLSYSSCSLPAYNGYIQYQQIHQQPPLLPLPIPARPHHSLPSGARGLSCPLNSAKKTNRCRDQSLTPKKSKSTKREQQTKLDLKLATQEITSEGLINASTNRLGPEPNDLPKDISRVLSSSSSLFIGKGNFDDFTLQGFEKFSGSVFTLSPPPSSLPLPKFSMKQKLKCNVEAAEVDPGATDNLRRILRLR